MLREKNYKITGEKVKKVTEEKDVGVTFDENRCRHQQ